jgi:hypothetical protein
VPFYKGEPLTGYDDYYECVDETHASWLIYHAAFTDVRPGTPEFERIVNASRYLGYDLQVIGSAVVTESDNANVSVSIQNKGVAPFYYDWQIVLALADGEGNIINETPADWKLTQILPGAPVGHKGAISTEGLSPGEYSLLMRVVNPLENGKNLRFSNESQDSVKKGWLTLGSLKVE